jgi:hypothetical protein
VVVLSRSGAGQKVGAGRGAELTEEENFRLLPPSLSLSLSLEKEKEAHKHPPISHLDVFAHELARPAPVGMEVHQNRDRGLRLDFEEKKKRLASRERLSSISRSKPLSLPLHLVVERKRESY